MPATRDKLLPYLGDGLADVAIGNLTVTEERLKEADFVPGDEGCRTIDEIVVIGPKSPELKSLEDLFGQEGTRAQGVKLLRQPEGAQRTLQERGKAGSPTYSRTRRA